MKRLVLMGVLLLGITQSQAFQGSAWLTIIQVNVRENEYHDIRVTGLPTGEGCTNNDHVVIDPNSPGADAMFLVALMADMAERKISVLIEGCAPMHPSVAHPSINMGFTAPKALRISLHKDH